MTTIVVALHQSALSERGWPSLTEDPAAAVERAARSIAYVAAHQRVVVAHSLSEDTTARLSDRLARELGRTVRSVPVHDAGGVEALGERDAVMLCQMGSAQDADEAASDLGVLLDAEMLVVVTRAPVVWDGTAGEDDARAVRSASPSDLESIEPDGTIEAALDAAMRFVKTTGRFAAVGAIDHLEAMVVGEGGTLIRDDGAPVAFYGAEARSD